MTVTSTIGAPGNTATLPSGLILRTGENVIAAEVFYQFTPYFLGSVFGEVAFTPTPPKASIILS